MKIGELFITLGMSGSKEVKKSLTEVLSGINLVKMGGDLLIKTFNNLIKDNVDLANSFTRFSKETGVSAEELQKWQGVAKGVGIASDTISNAIQSIADNQSKLKMGMGSYGGYALLGVDPTKDNPIDILEKIRQKSKDFDIGMQQQILAQMGLSQDLVHVLNLSNEEFNKMKGGTSFLSNNDIKSLNDGKKAIESIKQELSVFTSKVASSVMPVFKDVLKWVNDLLKRAVTPLRNILTSVVSRFKNIITMVKDFNRNSGDSIKALLKIVGVLKGLQLLSKANPLVWLFLLLDDLNAYAKKDQGWRSILGDLEDRFPALKGIFAPLKNGFQEILKLMDALAKGENWRKITDQWGLFAVAARSVGTALEMVVEALRFLTGEITFGDAAKNILKKFTDMFGKFYIDLWNQITGSNIKLPEDNGIEDQAKQLKEFFKEFKDDKKLLKIFGLEKFIDVARSDDAKVSDTEMTSIINLMIATAKAKAFASGEGTEDYNRYMNMAKNYQDKAMNNDITINVNVKEMTQGTANDIVTMIQDEIYKNLNKGDT